MLTWLLDRIWNIIWFCIVLSGIMILKDVLIQGMAMLAEKAEDWMYRLQERRDMQRINRRRGS